jgi:hypothetical protein
MMFLGQAIYVLGPLHLGVFVGALGMLSLNDR